MDITISRLKTFCALRSCKLRVGHPEKGFITVDSGGVVSPRTYSSFPPTGEMLWYPKPETLIPAANQFIVIEDGQAQSFSREEFEEQLKGVTG